MNNKQHHSNTDSCNQSVVASRPPPCWFLLKMSPGVLRVDWRRKQSEKKHPRHKAKIKRTTTSTWRANVLGWPWAASQACWGSSLKWLHCIAGPKQQVEAASFLWMVTESWRQVERSCTQWGCRRKLNQCIIHSFALAFVFHHSYIYIFIEDHWYYSAVAISLWCSTTGSHWTHRVT